jgi:hypothetical protein
VAFAFALILALSFWADLRFLAHVEALLEQLDQAELDEDIGVCAILNVSWFHSLVHGEQVNMLKKTWRLGGQSDS